MQASPVQPAHLAQRGQYFWVALVLAISFACCMAVNFFYLPRGAIMPDETRFLESAHRLATSGAFFAAGAYAFEMPGTAMFQAPFFIAFGASPVLAIRTAQAILLLVQAALSGWIALQLCRSRRSAIIAVAVTALYPFFIFFQGLMLSETLFDALLVAAMAALILWRERGLRADWSFALACLLFVGATYVKATLTFLPPLLFVAVALVSGAGIGRSMRILMLAMLVYAACLTPWWTRNYSILDTFVPFTTGAAPNLYLGNNPAFKGGADWATNTEMDKVERIWAIPGEVAQAKAFSALAMSYIKDHPKAFLKNMALKFVRFWNLIPNAQDFRTIFFDLASAASFGPVLLLAIICAAFSYVPQRQLIPFYVLFVYFTLLHVVTIASLRYRLPLDTFLIVMAAAPLGRVADAAAEFMARKRLNAGTPAA